MGKDIQLAEMKQIELRVLKQIREICEAQGFRYFLVGGTLLGAVRHQGFIPWDDDIDIGMPRPDYERFIDYCLSHDVPFKVMCNRSEKNYGYLYAKAMAPDTVILEESSNRYDVDMGIYVDIFPVDGLGDTRAEAVKKLNKTRFKRELLVAANWKKFSRSKTRPVYYEPIRLAFFCMSRGSSFGKLIRKIESCYDKDGFDKKNFVGAVCGAYRNREIVPREVVAETVSLPFEDTEFRCPKEYDAYLTAIYGDYMKLPPEEKRITHHSFQAYYKES